MVQTTAPINGDVAAVVVQFSSTIQRRTGIHRTKVKEAIEHGTIVSHIKVTQVLGVTLQVLRRDTLQEFHVVLRMEATHVVGAGTVRPINLHLPVEAVVEHEAVNYG